MSEATALVRLQEIDLALLRHRRAVEQLPQRARLAAAKAAVKKVNSELTRIMGQRKDVEIELADIEQDKRRWTEKVGEVQQEATQTSDYRDLQDIEDHLGALAKRLEKADFDSERLMEKLEAVEQAERNAKALGERLAREEQSLTESFKADTAEISAQVSELTGERARVLAEISPELQKRYETGVRRFGGVAVETLEGNRPSACRVALQPSSYADIRRSGKDVTTCPYCKRILVVSQEA